MTPIPPATVIVPVRNGGARLAACLDALVAQSSVDGWELIVVDNGSDDGSAELARRHRLGPQVLFEAAPGAYAARNTGVAAARSPVLAFLDGDCIADPSWLSAGLRAIAAGADMVGGRIVQEPAGTGNAWERYDRAGYARQREYVEADGFAATGNAFVRRAVLDAVGAFRADLTECGDLELGHRVRAAGFRLVYCEDATVHHPPRTTMSGTWHLHRRLGFGFAQLAAAGLRPPPWRDPALGIALGHIVEASVEAGTPARRREFLVPHAVAVSGRWVGRLAGAVALRPRS